MRFPESRKGKEGGKGERGMGEEGRGWKEGKEKMKGLRRQGWGLAVVTPQTKIYHYTTIQMH